MPAVSRATRRSHNARASSSSTSTAMWLNGTGPAFNSFVPKFYHALPAEPARSSLFSPRWATKWRQTLRASAFPTLGFALSLQPAVAPPHAPSQTGALPERFFLQAKSDLQVRTKAPRRCDDQRVDLMPKVTGVAWPPVSRNRGGAVDALRDEVPRPHLPLHEIASTSVDADAAEGQAPDGRSLQQAFRERSVHVLPAVDGDDGHHDGPDGIPAFGDAAHRLEALIDAGHVLLEHRRYLGWIDGP